MDATRLLEPRRRSSLSKLLLIFTVFLCHQSSSCNSYLLQYQAAGGLSHSFQQPQAPIGGPQHSAMNFISGLPPQPPQLPQSLAGTGNDMTPDNNMAESALVAPIFRYQVNPINGSSARLVWNLPLGYHTEFFEIKYGPIPDDTDVYSIRLNGTARNYTVNQLMPDTDYQFRITGFNGQQWYRPQMVLLRTPSANAVQKSHADVISQDIMPIGVKAEAKSNQSIQLSWTEPERPTNAKQAVRMNIIRYYINPSLLANATIANNNNSNTNEQLVQPQSQAASSTPQPQYHYLNVTNHRESRLIVQRLKPATEYAFAVKTVYHSPDMRRIYKQSGFSMDTIAKTFDLEPSPPRNFTIQLIQPTRDEIIVGQLPKLELNWLAPESPNGQLKSYVILYTNDQNVPDDRWSRIYVNDTTLTNWFISSLRPGASYYFKMRAINQKGASADSETRLYMAPFGQPADKMINNMPIPPNNILMLIVICLVAILFILFLVVSRLFCRTTGRSARKARKANLNSNGTKDHNLSLNDANPKLNGFVSTNSNASTVTGRVGTLMRRNQRNIHQDNSTNPLIGRNGKPDFWISALDQQHEIKSNMSDKSNDINMAAMVSIQRDSPQQFTTQTTQLASILPEYQFSNANDAADQQLMQQYQQQQQSHYRPGHFASNISYDQMDSANASALVTLSKRQQLQRQKYQIQFATTGPGANFSQLTNGGAPIGNGQAQAPSPHQQPPPPPPLNIEQQQHLHQPLYGTHQMANTRSLRLNRPTLYDPVSGSFLHNNAMGQDQISGNPPNYNSHLHSYLNNNNVATSTSNTLQFMHNPSHNHQTSTLLSRRSTNTLRSFQSAANGGDGGIGGGMYGFVAAPPTSMSGSNQSQQLLQSHQAVINQLNNSAYPSLPLKHVSAVRPQMMSSLEDQIEMEFAEKEEQQAQTQQQATQQSQDQQQQSIKQ